MPLELHLLYSDLQQGKYKDQQWVMVYVLSSTPWVDLQPHGCACLK
jgi:hypothetical protein